MYDMIKGVIQSQNEVLMYIFLIDRSHLKRLITVEMGYGNKSVAFLYYTIVL